MYPYDPWQRQHLSRRIRIPVHRQGRLPVHGNGQDSQQSKDEPGDIQKVVAQEYPILPPKDPTTRFADAAERPDRPSQEELTALKVRLQKRFASEYQAQKHDLLRDLLPLADHLQSALDFSAGQADESSLRTGIELTLRAFRSTLAQQGVIALDALGQAFDPQWHEAIAQQPSEHAQPGTVIEVVQEGYTLNGQLLRPARVIVSA